MSEGCLEGMLVTVPNQGFYLRRRKGDPIDQDLLRTAENLDLPGAGVAVFLRSDNQQPEAMRAYLDSIDPRVRAGYTLVLLDPDGTVAADADRLWAAA